MTGGKTFNRRPKGRWSGDIGGVGNPILQSQPIFRTRKPKRDAAMLRQTYRPLWIPAFAGMTEVVQNPPHARRDQCKTLPLDDAQGGIKGGLDRVWRVGNRESLLRCASRAKLAAQ